MFLKKISLTGFKSFAKKITLEFTPGITAIVGPNGSGKSNIADAIRWVMGEQSIKSLRGKKSQDVIFSGSDKKSRLGMAEVSLLIDNTDNKVPIDYSELSISRKIYQSSESEYLINNTTSKLSEINLLLTKANFGHRTYSVIGQGMIDNFLIATPKERKEFFEEATGVKQYQIKKNQSINKLNGVYQNLNTLNIKTNEMKPQLNMLTRQVNKLKKRKELEQTLDSIKQNYYSALWSEINQNYQQRKKQLDQLYQRRQKKYDSYQQIEHQINSLSKNRERSKELNQLRQGEQFILNQKIELKEKIIHLQVHDKQKPTSSSVSIDYKQLNGWYNLTQQLKQLQKELNQALKRNQLKLASNTLEAIDNTLKQLEGYLKLYLKKQEPTQKEQNQNNNQLKSHQQQLKELEKNIQNTQQKINELNQAENIDRDNLWQVQKNFSQAQKELNQIDADISEIRVSLARAETKRLDIKQEILTEFNSLQGLADHPQNLTQTQKDELYKKIQKLKNQLDTIGGIDPEVEQEYQQIKNKYDFLTEQMEDLKKTSHSLEKLINELNQIIRKQINQSHQQINERFKKYFKMLFNGGRAELKMIKNGSAYDDEQSIEQQNNGVYNFFQEKTNQPQFGGIEIEATPPGKKLKSINALSGGERALTSIALICAIISSNPAPFVVLDEVDAALDESNSIRFANILKELSKQSQFIIITHNRATMEKADLLYGVTMADDGISKILSIKLEETEKYQTR